MATYRTTQVYEVIDAYSEIFWDSISVIMRIMKRSITLIAWLFK